MVKINFLVVFLFILFFYTILNAQQDTIILPSTEIKAAKNQIEDFEIIRIIDAENIQNSPINNINDVLDFVQGIDLRERGNMGVQADISSRGGTFEQTIVMLNGVVMNNPQTGHYTLDLPINPDDIDRIEILKGHLPRINGANAFSGAINIITKPNKTNNIRLSLSGGQFGWYSTNGSVSFNTHNTSNLLSVGRMSSDGYIKNTDFVYDKFYLQNNADFNKIKTQIEVGISNKRAGANSFYTAKYPDQFDHTISAFVQGNIKYTFNNNNIIIQPYYRRHQDRFELFRDNPPIWYAGHNYHLTHVKGVKTIAQYFSKFGVSNLGFDYKQEVINSNVLGFLTGDSIKAAFEKNGFYNKGFSRYITNVFANQSIDFNKISLSAGAILHYDNKSNFIINPGADIIYKTVKKLHIGFSFSQAVRIPTFTDLFYSGPVNIGNPDLKPEQSTKYELSINYGENKPLKMNASVFYRQGKNLIDWVRLADSLPWQSVNHTSLNTYGIEISFYLTPISFGKNNKFIKGLWFDYSYITSDKQAGEWISYYVLDYLKHKSVLRIEHQIIKNLSATWIINYQDRAGSYSDFNTNAIKDFKDFYTINTRLKYVYQHYNFYCDINNITNIKYIDFGNIYQPELWLKFGITANITIKKKLVNK